MGFPSVRNYRYGLSQKTVLLLGCWNTGTSANSR
uniref:U1764r n=1 Tax=Mycobacterium leprae TaxID=1769 RepID=Q50001_MYCLR|nr:u1764r [Mycobacterium leprae]